jgi:hypothetical protein
MKSGELVPASGSDLVFTDWHEYLSAVRELFPHEQQWIFRGQSDARWKLQSKLERELQRYGKSIASARDAEYAILREFLRRYKNYDQAITIRDAMDALSFIQHFGGPTRYLDWSYSIYVASFFALRGATVDGRATVWCFRASFWNDEGARPRVAGKDFARNPTSLNSELMKIFGLPLVKSDGSIARRDHNEGFLNPCVFQVTPYSLNVNIERQQGLFMMPSRVELGFEGNLAGMIEKSPGLDGWLRRIDLECSDQFLRSALVDLRRMSLTNEVLFGGPSSFCEALALGIVDRYNLQTPATGVRI